MKLISLTNDLENMICENFTQISKNKIKINKGTSLYHGTIEKFDANKINVGAYDNILWSTDKKNIARTYVPSASLKIRLSTDDIIKPTKEEEIIKIQKLLGIEYDINSFEEKNGRIISWLVPKIFNNLSKDVEKRSEVLGDLYKKEKEIRSTYKSLTGNESDQYVDSLLDNWESVEEKIKKLETEMSINDPNNAKREYVNNKLSDLGYEPINNTNSSNKQWLFLFDSSVLLKPNQKAQGRLLTITLKKDMIFYDLTNGGDSEGDLTDLDYNKLELFNKINKSGFDGVKINDFAQSDEYGNVGHVSYGFFKKSIKYLHIEEEYTQHPIKPLSDEN